MAGSSSQSEQTSRAQPAGHNPPLENQNTNAAFSRPPREVVVTDFNMSFGSMVVFIIKWVVASIPALIILWLVMAVIIGILGGIFGGFLGAF
jgi:hypothetical protein